MTETRQESVGGDAPLNLRLHRAPRPRTLRFPTTRGIQRLGWFIPGGLMLMILTTRRGSPYPAAAALAAAGLVGLAAGLVARRRRAVRDDMIDERSAESFPASDAPGY